MSKISEAEIGKKMRGRVRSYSNQDGYGFIFTEDGKDLFVSSHALGKKEKKVSVGTVLEFTIGKYKDKIVATEIEVINKFKDGITKISLPDGTELPIKAIHKFGRSNAFKTISQRGFTEKDLKDHGYTVKDLDYVFVETPRTTYMFFGNTSPIKANGKTDIKEFYKYLRTALIEL